MKLHRTVLLKISEPNKGKLRKLKLTIELYHKVLLFYLDVIPRLGMYRMASMSNKEALSFLERHTVSTKAHPVPKFPIFSGVQANIRRSAINKAVGMVKSYLSNLYRWHKEGKELGHKKPSYPNPKRSSLTYYATDVQFKDVLKSSGGIPPSVKSTSHLSNRLYTRTKNNGNPLYFSSFAAPYPQCPDAKEEKETILPELLRKRETTIETELPLGY